MDTLDAPHSDNVFRDFFAEPPLGRKSGQNFLNFKNQVRGLIEPEFPV